MEGDNNIDVDCKKHRLVFPTISNYGKCRSGAPATKSSHKERQIEASLHQPHYTDHISDVSPPLLSLDEELAKDDDEAKDDDDDEDE
ncbi:Uncharacterized protein TCM_024482 [Theobroma cacao]|uniref:Uncharacterized protein n=1 Tax=Theobroma cacao TaxID=3641 RepID=A0A061EWA6_THECC|nr:Uncharacterized protein TCM_024482 [Theobroma cacao]